MSLSINPSDGQQIAPSRRVMQPLLALDSICQDLIYAARSLRRSPGLVLTVAISLGLGIGVNTTVFNLFNITVLAKPTAVEPERLVSIEPGNGNRISYPNYKDLGASPAFAGMAVTTMGTVNLRDQSRVENVIALETSPNYFQLLGVSAYLGRTFSPDDGQSVVLSYSFWQKRFQGDTGALGRSFHWNGQPLTIGGILSRDFRPGTGAVAQDVYLPVSTALLPLILDRRQAHFSLLARLAPAVTHSQAQAAFTALARPLEQAYPEDNQSFGKPPFILPIYGIGSFAGHGGGEEVLVSFGAPFLVTGLLLLIACANVAGVVLARGAMRQREIAIRLALGASRRRLAQILLAETLLLSLTGAAAGLLLTAWVTPLLSQIRVPNTPQLPPLGLHFDTNLALYALAMALATCAGCGIIPALQSSGSKLLPGLKQTVLSGRGGMRRFLVAAQVAGSVLLLMTCALFLRSLMYLGNVNPGFDLEHSITAKIVPEQNWTEAQTYQAANQLAERVAAVPGVRSVSYASLIPLGGDSVATDVAFKNALSDQPGLRPPVVLTSNVGPRYFATMGIPILRGREFATADRQGAPLVAIVNQAFAARFFPGGAALGKFMRIASEKKDVPWRQIVGIAANNDYRFIGEPPEPQFFLPFLQTGGRIFLQISAFREPDATVAAVRRAIAEQDSSLQSDVQTTRQATSLELTLRRFATLLLAAMGSLGLLLAMTGLYGVLSWEVSRRTAEIGIRIALGASAGSVRRMVLRRSLAITAVGITVGGGAAMLLAIPLAPVLKGAGPADPIAIFTVAAALSLVSAAASWSPVRRASHIDPISALRYE
jgi:predicted permease